MSPLLHSNLKKKKSFLFKWTSVVRLYLRENKKSIWDLSFRTQLYENVKLDGWFRYICWTLNGNLYFF